MRNFVRRHDELAEISLKEISARESYVDLLTEIWAKRKKREISHGKVL
jgi:hypothetical protein